PPFNIGNAQKKLLNSLTVEPGRDSELIYVTAAAEAPDVAEQSVNAVIHAYDEIYARQGSDEITQKISRLEDEQKKLERVIRYNDQEIGKLLTKWSTSDLRFLQGTMTANQQKLDEQIGLAEGMLARLKAAADTPQIMIDPTPRELEQFDPTLGQLRAGLEQAKDNF